MDFFGHQARARGQSRRLLVLFALAVLAIVLAVDAVVLGALLLTTPERGALPLPQLIAAHGTALAVTSLVVLAFIGLASLTKIADLRSGGGAVARDLGATLVPAATSDPARRRLRNVVEEIAIASGVPVPEIYVLEREEGINAFAAGWSPADAAVCVTRGALERLDRDELQGVIAHEFSHVLNGDMRLNIRLMGVLFGILLLAVVGRELLRRMRFRTGGRNKGAGTAMLIAFGVMVVGYVGLFFGRLIKAGVSRQREYLADAAAVQFTRQSRGIARALKKIAATPTGSRLEVAQAEQVSHMLFGDGLGLSGLFATHPPLPSRIERLEGRYSEHEVNALARELAAPAGAAPAASGAPLAGPSAPLPAPDTLLGLAPAALVGQVGNPSPDAYAAAGALLGAIPAELARGAADPEIAPALVLGLALSAEPAARERQLGMVGSLLGAAWRERVMPFAASLAKLHPLARLPLIELAVPALRARPPRFTLAFGDTLKAMVQVDGEVTVAEYCLTRMVRVQLADALDPTRVKVLGRRRLADCALAARTLIAALAAQGHADQGAARRAYAAGTQHLPGPAAPYAPPEDWPTALDAAFGALDRLDAAGKELLIEALVRTLSHDGRVTLEEAELLRASCASLHCPLPPQLVPAG